MRLIPCIDLLQSDSDNQYLPQLAALLRNSDVGCVPNLEGAEQAVRAAMRLMQGSSRFR